ncbi:MAG: hydrophobic protein [Acidimicrobiales bacterium]
MPWWAMGCLLVLVLFGALALAGAGFAMHLLWILSVVFFFCWLAGHAFRRGSNRAQRRWRR